MEFTQENIIWYIKYYIQEIVEALAAILIYKMLSSKEPLDYLSIFKSSLVIGAITTVLETYDSSYKTSVKNGVLATVGTIMIKGV